MSDLGTAIAITSVAFKDKTDKGGHPYILHCLHVMNKMKYYDDHELMSAAVMHDLIEDTSWTIDQLRSEGFSEKVLTIVDALTHKDGESYQDYITRIKQDPDAVKIKIQDLRHNSDILRIKGVRKKDIERIEKYHKAYTFLLS